MGCGASAGKATAKVDDKPAANLADDEDPPVKQFGKRRKRDSIVYNKEAMDKRLAAADPTAKAPASMVESV
jgi:hypothetical protein